MCVCTCVLAGYLNLWCLGGNKVIVTRSVSLIVQNVSKYACVCVCVRASEQGWSVYLNSVISSPVSVFPETLCDSVVSCHENE